MLNWHNDRSKRPAGGAAWRWRFACRAPVSETVVAGNVGTGARSPKMARLEAALFVADGALPARRLAQFATLADPTEVRTLIRKLNDLYDAEQSAFRVEQVAAGYQLLTRPEFAFWLSKLHQRQAELKLSPPGLETLAIIAYRQPIIRADIEAIRGVSCTEIIKQLMDRGLVRIGGADDTLGRPHLYETTRQFLETFGLRSIDDLPMAARLRPQRAVEAPPESTEAAA
ncbi:MAG TPA: SMC-Scp complex subunit ScpB [Planctomycetaceae bacterium]|nr:SMC-Scp complex subunit ScpB [Planctomycetaceae bacterium]